MEKKAEVSESRDVVVGLLHELVSCWEQTPGALYTGAAAAASMSAQPCSKSQRPSAKLLHFFPRC